MKPFALMTRENFVSFYHMQMPRWLFSDPKYKTMSLHAKVAYTFLLNRCQLSQRNGWVNDENEVYIIFTRGELAEEMQISYKKAIACFAELQEANLIWEQRRGRGLANLIYLAAVEHEVSQSYSCAPFVSSDEEAPAESLEDSQDGFAIPNVANEEETPGSVSEADIPEESEMQKVQVKTCPDDISRPVEASCLDLSNLHTSNIYKNNKEKRNTDIQSVCPLKEGELVKIPVEKRKSDKQLLDMILENSELDYLKPDEQSLFENVITWLFYAEEVRIGKCCYPQEYVRSRLHLLNSEILYDTAQTLYANRTRIHGNALCYAAKVLFSHLTEVEARFSLDPYLNEMRSIK